MPAAPAIEKCTRFRDRAMASFIIDDVCGHTAPDAEAFKRFSAWVAHAGLKGECTALAGMQRNARGAALPLHRSYCKEVASASGSHLDAFMEVMTHNALYDFAKNRIRANAQHEGVWLLDKKPSADEYCDYFAHIARVVNAAGFRHAGLTIPGCGCAPCVALKKSLRIKNLQATDFNSGVFVALLDLLREQTFAGPVFGLFVGETGQGPADAQVMIEDGPLAVYDVPPGVRGDSLGRWDNDPQYLDLDSYITADGRGGRLPELIAQSSRTLIYYGHWQSQRPDRGIGHAAFKEIAARLKKHHGEEIVWMRPTEIAAYRHTERHTQVRPDGRGFELRLPFPALHALTFRVRGSAKVRLQTPGGKVLKPWRALPGEAGALFEFLPENGRYELLFH